MTGPDERPVLPDRTDADRDEVWGDRSEPDDDVERLRAERPPHHEDRD